MYRLAFLAVIVFQIGGMRAADGGGRKVRVRMRETPAARQSRQEIEVIKGIIAASSCAVMVGHIASKMLPESSPWHAKMVASVFGASVGFELGDRAVVPRGGYVDKKTNPKQKRPDAEVSRERMFARGVIFAVVAAYGVSQCLKTSARA